jgi:hypothetical protein
MAEKESRLSHAHVVLQQLIKQGDNCPICHEAMKDPMESPCDYIVCHQCITNWLSGPGTTCPSCRGDLAPSGLRPVEQRPEIVQPASAEQTADNRDTTVQRSAQTFARFFQQVRAGAARSQGNAAEQDGCQAVRREPTQPHQRQQTRNANANANANANTQRRATRATASSSSRFSTANTSTTRPPRPLLTILRSVPSAGPLPAQAEEIRAIFQRAQGHYHQIRSGNHTPQIKN